MKKYANRFLSLLLVLVVMLSVIPAVAAEEAETGLWNWYVPEWNSQVAMTQEEDCLSFTYDRSTVGWSYVAIAAKGEFSGGDSFRLTMDFGEERGYSSAFMIRFLYADNTYSDVWMNAQQGKAEYNVQIPADVTAVLQEVQLCFESPYDPFESKVVSVKVYDAAMMPKMKSVGLGDWYIPWWDNKLTMAEEAGCLSFTYDRANASWSYFAAPATQSVGAGGTFSFVLDFGPDRGYTSAFMIRFQYADNTNADIWVNAKEGKAQYDVTVPYEATSTVSEVQIYPESPYDSFESKTVTVRLYEAFLTVVPMVYEGLNPFYYPSLWGDNGSWATENPITVDWSNPTAMEVSYGSRSGSAAGWKCIIAEPTVAVSGGATLTMDLEFFPERTGNFLVSFYADGTSVHDAYVDVTGKRATYTLQIPESVQQTITEVRIHPENPWAADLPNEASALRFYSMILSPKEDPNKVEGYNLVLGDNIGVNFYLHLNPQFVASANAALQVTVDGKASLLPIGLADEKGQYVFSVGVSAAQMTTPIVLQLVADDFAGEEWTYTVADYAKYILDGNFTDETKNLVRAMLDYGGKAQTYFNYSTENMANAGLFDLPEYIVPNADDDALIVGGTVPGVHVYGATLVLRTRVAIRYYFTMEEGYDHQFAVNSQACNVVKQADGTCYVEIADITPQNLDKEYTLTVTDGENSLTVTYSVLDYITRMYAKDTSSDALKQLVKSLYTYGMTAKIYCNSVCPEEELLRYSVEYTFHQATPNVSNSTDWKYAPRLGNGVKPAEWTSMGVWGSVYIQEGAEYVDNVAVELSNMKLWGYSPTKGWQLLSYEIPRGGFYDEDFTGDDSVQFPEKMRIDEVNLTNTVLLDAETMGRNYHPFGSQLDLVAMGMEDVQYVISTMDARLVMWDENGHDNRAQAKYCFNVGGDWWAYPGAVWNEQWTTNKEIAIGQYRPVQTWTTRAYMSTIPSELFDELVPAELLAVITA